MVLADRATGRIGDCRVGIARRRLLLGLGMPQTAYETARSDAGVLHEGTAGKVYAMNKITVTMDGKSLEIEFDADIEISEGKVVARSKYYQPFVYTYPAYGQPQQQIALDRLMPTTTWAENQITR